MSNERIYNIALDMFMEEKIKLMQQFKKFPKTLYYNQKDKEHLLYNLDPTLAKQIWERLKYNIYCKGASWISQSTCPFCIESKIRFIEIDKNICKKCTYKKNHRHIICMSPHSDLSRICNSRIFTINNSQYSNIIKEISKELFESNNINDNSKESTVEYDNFRVIVKQNYKNNKIDKFPCNALYSWYDFTHQHVGDEIISAYDIEDINNREFENVDPKTVKMVFELAEKCDVSNNSDVLYNFIVYPNGEIKINYDMKRIKEFLEEIKKEYDEYLKNKCNIVKVEVKD